MNSLYFGVTGSSLILIAFFLNLFKIITVESKTYLLLNILGSGLMIYYAYLLNSIPFLILNIVWTFFALFKFVKISFKKAL